MVPPFVIDLAIAALVIGMAIFGRRDGLFVATIVGMQILVSFVASLAVSMAVAHMVRSNGGDPKITGWIAAAIYVIGFVASVSGVRLALATWVPEMAVPLTPRVDAWGGAVIGSVSGWLLAGAIVVAWSMASLPGPWRFRSDALFVDPGQSILRTFARFIEFDRNRRSTMLDGEAAKGALEEPPYCSEPFIDANGNGFFDLGEPFIDVNHDGIFTPRQSYIDANGNGRRDFGLIESYRFGAWNGVTVWHAPRISSTAREELAIPPEAGDVIYRATAEDADGPEGLLFTISSSVGDGAASAILEVDERTGEVVLVQSPGDQFTKFVKFTVLVTDKDGLTDELPVRVVW
jgi:hypothetical protein